MGQPSKQRCGGEACDPARQVADHSPALSHHLSLLVHLYLHLLSVPLGRGRGGALAGQPRFPALLYMWDKHCTCCSTHDSLGPSAQGLWLAVTVTGWAASPQHHHLSLLLWWIRPQHQPWSHPPPPPETPGSPTGLPGPPQAAPNTSNVELAIPTQSTTQPYSPRQ